MVNVYMENNTIIYDTRSSVNRRLHSDLVERVLSHPLLISTTLPNLSGNKVAFEVRKEDTSSNVIPLPIIIYSHSSYIDILNITITIKS